MWPAVLRAQPIRLPLQKNLFFAIEIIRFFALNDDAIRS